MLASLGWDGTVCLWDAPSSRLIRRLGRTVQRKSDYWGDALAFSPDGRRLAVACADSTVHVWEVASGDEVFTLRGHRQEVTSVAYSPDGRRIAAAGWDQTIKLWDAATGDEVFTLRGHTGGVLGLAFTPDGFRLLSTGADCMVRAWDATPLEEKPAATLEPRSASEWNGEGAWCATQHLWDEAVHAFTRAIELEPEFGEAWLSRGLAHANLHKDDEALADFTKAIKLKPKNAIVQNNFAWFLATCPDAKHRDPARAVELAKKAVELAPKEGGHWNTLGVAHYRAGDWKAAVEAFTKSMELRKGGDSFDWFFLAMAHWNLSEKEKARKWFDQAAQWMDKNAPHDEELSRFRAEAAELLGVKKKT
jgi:Flp pilus assembly protein TadD